MKAFILGAGLGTRLRPLTEERPKPLIPVLGRPLIYSILDRIYGAGIRDVAINTHHRAEVYEHFFPDESYDGQKIAFFYEPEVLETGGGIKNLEDWTGEDALLVHNGDIYTDLDLRKIVEEHRKSGNAVTMVLRSEGDAQHVTRDMNSGLVVDIRGMLGRKDSEKQEKEESFLFTGIYVVEPVVRTFMQAGEKISIISVFLEMMRQGLRIGGLVMDEGEWFDLGTREEYLRLQMKMLEETDGNFVATSAVVETGAVVAQSVLGPGVVVEAGSECRRSVVWDNAVIRAGAVLEDCVVREGKMVEQSARGVDI